MTRSIDSQALDAILAEAVASGAVPHVAAIVGDADGTLYEGGAGAPVAGQDGGTVGASTPFRIMSMTKMIATTAALQQVEKGLLDLDAPVTDYCPEFKEVQVLEGWDGDTPVLVEPRTPATVRHLVTHTSGLGYWFWSEDLVRFEAATGVPNVVPGSAEAFKAPMVAHPGETFTYGINTDWLGKVVESVAGTTLDVVIGENVTGPLGMGDTTFHLSEVRQDDLAMVHVPGEEGWVSAGGILNEHPDWWAGGHGLYSTPRDYLRFQRALLRGGELDGTRILSEQMVDQAFSHQLGDLSFPEEIPTADPPITSTLRVGPGWTWGYGLLINNHDVPGGRRAGTGAWAGLFNTHFFIDRTTGVAASIYTNSLPFVTEDAWKLYGAVEQAVYAAL
ncbi:serine hydrolase domain-containing protein [Nocardioides bruguierae]|uniref:serine hydrolase domain-containing protein n=1 Tax=Nocardioides bruguierae TaxID=2945102 RepID=UPI002021C6B8|nr:serine hydrolase domain-containing protein [Nocardioides bruguierae]MCL8024316.1 beta-lactamase family protein [Nocardioides bruguierae]